MVPKRFLPAHLQMLPIKEKGRIRDGHLTNITNKQAGKERKCTPRINAVLKSVKS